MLARNRLTYVNYNVCLFIFPSQVYCGLFPSDNTAGIL